MLKKITTPSNNMFCGVEFILRGAKKRRAMAVSNAVAINAESGIQAKLQAVKGWDFGETFSEAVRLSKLRV